MTVSSIPPTWLSCGPVASWGAAQARSGLKKGPQIVGFLEFREAFVGESPGRTVTWGAMSGSLCYKALGDQGMAALRGSSSRAPKPALYLCGGDRMALGPHICL